MLCLMGLQAELVENNGLFRGFLNNPFGFVQETHEDTVARIRKHAEQDAENVSKKGDKK